jgi:hypothetical protein
VRIPKRWAKLTTRLVLVFCLTGFAGSLLVLETAAPTGASPWSSVVTLSGHVETQYAHTNCVTGLYLSASDGEHGWASLGSGCLSRSYWFTFEHVPGGSGLTVHWTITAKILGGSGSFGLARPTTGQTAYLDICTFHGVLFPEC